MECGFLHAGAEQAVQPTMAVQGEEQQEATPEEQSFSETELMALYEHYERTLGCEACSEWVSGYCSKGENCNFSHLSSEEEVRDLKQQIASLQAGTGGEAMNLLANVQSGKG